MDQFLNTVPNHKLRKVLASGIRKTYNPVLNTLRLKSGDHSL
jgi:hypothetical protein